MDSIILLLMEMTTEFNTNLSYKTYLLKNVQHFSKLMRTKTLNGMLLSTLANLYKERFWKGLKAAVDGLVKKYIFKPSNNVLWLVVGRESEYFIIDNIYCSCYDFYLNTVIRKETPFCYHIIARIIAEALDLYETYILSDNKYKSLIEEWRSFSYLEE